MASLYKKTIEIADAFTKYMESKDLSLIEQFTRDEIEIALLQLIKDQDSPYYMAMQIKREELKEIENHKREKSVKWKERMIGVIAGIILGLILVFLKLIFFP